MHTLSKNTLLTITAVAAYLCAGPSTLLAQEKIQLPIDISDVSATDKISAKQDMSYGLGFQNGEQFASYGFIADDIDKEAYIKGLITALMKKDFGKDPGIYDQAMKTYDKIVTMRERGLAEANESAEMAFMAENGKRKEVTTTASNLQYEILKKGAGEKYSPPEGIADGMDAATQFHIKCTGTLLDGTLFMKTPGDAPLPFDLQVIPGLAEALKMMPVGSKWKLYMPATLGFGDIRQGPKVSPKSMLIYLVELTEIKTRALQPKGPQPLVPR
jgi:FKBP-type peptidyl-prolyl cis-trans isomerase